MDGHMLVEAFKTTDMPELRTRLLGSEWNESNENFFKAGEDLQIDL